MNLQDKLFASVALAMLAAWWAAHASLTADAYITFRVVDNAVHGYGLRWNVAERVQVYTHPLWLLLHIPFYALWENIFWVTESLSIACNLAALGVTMLTFRRPWPQALALLIIPFGISSSLSVSGMLGLENPLTHLLFACFGWALFRAGSERFWFYTSFFCALSLVNRLDTVVFYAPIMLGVVITRRQTLRWPQCLLGLLPIMLWEGFSLIYYGFLFPNTAYDKLPGSPFDADGIAQGLHYLLSLFTLDITSALALLMVMIGVPILWRRGMLDMRVALIVAGMLAYCLYVIDVGGTFLAGRLWSLPIFASLWLLYALPAQRVRPAWCCALIVWLLAVKAAYPNERTIRRACPACLPGISSQWFHLTTHGLSNNKQPDGGHERLTVRRGGEPVVQVFTGVGFAGYEAGPSVFIVDPFGVTDPLLARLPGTGVPMTQSVIQHMARRIPQGYVHLLETGDAGRMDPSLARYYEKLHLITSGDLWSRQRLRTIAAFNFGAYNHWRGDYIAAGTP